MIKTTTKPHEKQRKKAGELTLGSGTVLSDETVVSPKFDNLNSEPMAGVTQRKRGLSTTGKTYESGPVFAALEIAEGLAELGLMNARQLGKFRRLGLVPIPVMAAKDICELRNELGISQSVLARLINVSTNTVGQWERGEKKPSGSAQKLLYLLKKNGIQSLF